MRVNVRERGTDKFIKHRDLTAADAERYNRANGRFYIEIPKDSMIKPIRTFYWQLAICLSLSLFFISSGAAYRWGWTEIQTQIIETSDGQITTYTEHHWRFLSYDFKPYDTTDVNKTLNLELVREHGKGKFVIRGNRIMLHHSAPTLDKQTVSND